MVPDKARSKPDKSQSCHLTWQYLSWVKFHRYLLRLTWLSERRKVSVPVAADALAIDPNHSLGHLRQANGDGLISFWSIEVCLQKQ